MDIGQRIKSNRKAHHLSQEDLAEKIYVSRQTISNWENDKSYPDIQSLLRLSDTFKLSLDELIKGDVDLMRKKIQKEDIQRLNRQSCRYLIAIIITLISLPILYYILSWTGLIIWLPIALGMVYQASKVEGLKTEYDIQIFREIDAFMKGESLDQIHKAVESGKRPYQKVIMVILSAVIGFLFAYLSMTLLEWLF